jgi:enamine deaminase RidA (YjgF/YER057c/UK114 family)
MAMQFNMIASGLKPVAPFSHAVEVDGTVFVTGPMPDTPEAPGKLPKRIEDVPIEINHIAKRPVKLAPRERHASCPPNCGF